ncbi:MAG: DUF4160 domain-containing protein [Bacillota bacterium]
MPKVFEHKGYKFFFFSNEGNPLEPAHIHVRRENLLAKFWLEPEVILANSWGMKAHELKILQTVIEENQEYFKKRWHDHFG